jgi:hypothetical protein
MKRREPEALWGLPEDLPSGERIVWQGQPVWRDMALRVFHVRKIAIYFAILAAVHVAFQIYEGAGWAAAAMGAAWLILLGASALLVLGVLAKLYANTTIYTITNHRLVLRFGVALPMMINIPWHRVTAADLQLGGHNTGSIALTVAPGQKLSYWLLWPYAKPWRFSPVQPMLRCISDPADVAEKLRLAVSEHDGSEVTAVPDAPSSTVPGLDTAAGPRSAAFS